MAIFHLAMKPISRSSGRSSVAAAAYRAGARLINARDGQTHDFTRRTGVVHAEIVLPNGSSAEWARDRSALWNAVEAAERRKDARVAREFEIALPHELSAEQRRALTQAFAQDLADRYGAAVDFAIHEPGGAGDIRNHHAHLLMTTRAVTSRGLGEKTLIERENKALRAMGEPTTQDQLAAMRVAWEELANVHLALAGLDVRVDHRSHTERGLKIEPTEHQGVNASQIERQGGAVSRRRIDEAAAARNAALIRERPAALLDILTGEKSVFDRRDIARAMHRYVDDPQAFQNALATMMTSAELVELQPEKRDTNGKIVSVARYSTQDMIDIECAMAGAADRLRQARDHRVDRRHVVRAVARQDTAIQLSSGNGATRLSDEQRAAIAHLTGPERIAAVVGIAGAGKSTMLAAAREAWEAAGYRVHGAALAGKAAEGLEESSGIAACTLASWERSWANGASALSKGDVLVIDEAGMIGSRQLARFIVEAEQRGAKIVAIGDPEQLQPIGAGAAFRAIAERIGFAHLEVVRRQSEDWQREATRAFATQRTKDGLDAYHKAGAIQFCESGAAVRAAIVRDVLAHMDEWPDQSRIVLAHRRTDVRQLNNAIRTAIQARGKLGGEMIFQTEDGPRTFAPGDRIVFLQNDRLGCITVKNGMLATVERVADGKIVARIDGRTKAVTIPFASYGAIDHGYATTIHKAQGVTVDRTFVLTSTSMDRHLSYVAMTRHRDGAKLYATRDKFSDLDALAARLGRAAMKETTLDYAARRGIERARKSETIMEQPVAASAPQRDHTIDEAGQSTVVSRRQRLVHLARTAFVDGDRVAEDLAHMIARKGADVGHTADQLRAAPESFGALRGARSIFGENDTRRAARRAVGVLASEALKLERARAIDIAQWTDGEAAASRPQTQDQAHNPGRERRHESGRGWDW